MRNANNGNTYRIKKNIITFDKSRQVILYNL